MGPHQITSKQFHIGMAYCTLVTTRRMTLMQLIAFQNDLIPAIAVFKARNKIKEEYMDEVC